MSWAQRHSEKIMKELTFEKKSPANALMISNINGDITVEGYSGDKILVEVEKIIIGKTEARLEKGKSEIKLGIKDLADTLILFTDGLCNKFNHQQNGKNRHSDWNGWGYNWDDCNNRGDDYHKNEYEYRMNYTVKVPAGLSVRVSTINNGDVTVNNVTGTVYANNINGSIKLSKLAGKTHSSTINGDVDLDYVSNPSSDCRYYTLNGDINANFKKGLGASVSFESYNGAFYTNVDELEALPVEMEKKETSKGVKFKIRGNRFKIGKGGVLLDFETFNGNVYLKEI
jgi:DUF4097 and DUF4098 domain-containing protein YvlB